MELLLLLLLRLGRLLGLFLLLLGPALFLPGYLFYSLRTAHAQLTMRLFRQRA